MARTYPRSATGSGLNGPVSGLMHVLCLDVGSSSLKFALYQRIDGEIRLDTDGTVPNDGAANAATGLGQVIKKLPRLREHPPDAIGHRIVFGGTRYKTPVLVDDRVVEELESLAEFDPLHMLPQIKALHELGKRYPVAPQVVCFDTAFHRDIPDRARRLPIPLSLGSELQRFGFHGLSYEYIVATVDDASRGKAVIAHLGSGASMCALEEGKALDTTMGFSPLSGLMMATRPGDLDPGVLIHLIKKGMDSGQLSELLYEHSGLRAVSETTDDVRTLLESSATDPRAAFAIELFVYQARKQLGAMIAVLGGLDALIFTGGIGAGSAEIRERICQPFEFAGIQLVESRNRANAGIISAPDARVRTRVVPTDENLMIARHVSELLPAGDVAT